MIQTRFFASIHTVGLDREAWNALAAGSETNTVFQTHQWMSSWEKVFGDQCEPWVISVEDPAGVVGVAPLMVKKGLLGERRVMFLGEGKADYSDFLTAGDRLKVLEGVSSALFTARERWEVIELNNIPAESSTVALLQGIFRRAGYRTLVRDLYQSPTLLIRGHEDEALKIFNKAGLRRRENYFQRNGQLTYKTMTGMDVMPYLDRFFDLHVGRWAGSGSPSLFLKEVNRTFYRELAVAMADNMYLRLCIIEFDGEPLAMHYGFDYNGRLLWYKPSFDRAQEKHSPGLVLLRYLIGYAIDHKREEFDFTIGDEPFKRRFSNHLRTTVSLQIFQDPVRYYYALLKQNLSAAKKRFV